MKLGIALLAGGIILLILVIPYSIVAIVVAVTQLQGGNVSGGIPAYLGIAGVLIGLLMTGIGAVRVFKQ
jgi:hypothetical protein